MRAVLFGQSGQVGEALLKADCDDIEWICPDRSLPQGDLLNPNAIGRFLKEVNPQAIVNAAAFTAVDEAQTDFEKAKIINAEAPKMMARTAADIGAYFIHLSTDYVFNGSGSNPWSEDDAADPINAYGVTKLLGERAVTEQNDSALILRLSWLHAPLHKNFITAIAERLKTQQEIVVVDDQWGSPTAAHDAAEVILKTLTEFCKGQTLTGIYHFANSGFCSRFQCAQEVIRQLQQNEVSWAFDKKLTAAKTDDFFQTQSRPLNCKLNTEKLCRDLKIAPRPWQEALGATLRSYY